MHWCVSVATSIDLFKQITEPLLLVVTLEAVNDGLNQWLMHACGILGQKVNHGVLQAINTPNTFPWRSNERRNCPLLVEPVGSSFGDSTSGEIAP
jgi:hypothetical protein